MYLKGLNPTNSESSNNVIIEIVIGSKMQQHAYSIPEDFCCSVHRLCHIVIKNTDQFLNMIIILTSVYMKISFLIYPQLLSNHLCQMINQTGKNIGY